MKKKIITILCSATLCLNSLPAITSNAVATVVTSYSQMINDYSIIARNEYNCLEWLFDYQDRLEMNGEYKIYLNKDEAVLLVARQRKDMGNKYMIEYWFKSGGSDLLILNYDTYDAVTNYLNSINFDYSTELIESENKSGKKAITHYRINPAELLTQNEKMHILDDIITNTGIKCEWTTPEETSVIDGENDNSLKDTASTYEADTDYLNISNYYYDPEVNTSAITGYSYESIIPVKDYTALAKDAAKYSDASFGISVLEVLAHNGLISAGDIKKDADKLNTIGDSEELRKLITDYQSLLGKTEFGMAKNYSFKSKSSKDKIPELVSIAEKASKDKKYFLIMYGSYNTKPTELEKSMGFTDGSNVIKAHSAVGIGITNGSWTFNGKEYDQCILTLDSVNVKADTGAFSDNTCIYINSSTNDYYIPAYSENAESDLHIVAINDDKLLNFDGVLSPTNKFDTDISDIINVTMTNKNTTALYEITAYSGEKNTVLNKENDYMDNFHNQYNGNLFIKADSISISRQSESNVDEITLSKNDSYAQIELKKADSVIDFDGKTYKLQYKEDKDDATKSILDYGISLNSKDANWSFYGDTTSSVSFTPSKNGVVITGKNDSLSAELPAGDKSIKTNIFVSGSVLVNADQKGNINLMIDKNNDGEFESAATKGDVDCNGKIDAADASLVLADYNNASVGEKTILNSSLADYNEDGKIDADDATQILIEYARLSTT